MFTEISSCRNGACAPVVHRIDRAVHESNTDGEGIVKGTLDRNMQKEAAKILIVGMGVTGLSVARYLHAHNIAFRAYDSREQVSQWDLVIRLAGTQRAACGAWNERYLDGIEQLILSPGLSLKLDFVRQAIDRGIEVIGDIELFARAANAPVIAITGSNGKSTVTDLMGKMLAACGYRVKVGGNIGTAALDLLEGDAPDFYVLELSSFQLETTETLRCAVSIILNITPDHMDRYDDFADYAAAKFRICLNAENVIIGEELRDAYTTWKSAHAIRVPFISIAKQGGGAADWELANQNGEITICHNGTALLPVSRIKLSGSHNHFNVTACIAALSALNIDPACAFHVLQQYSGLSHRMQPVRVRHGVTWYNDSKATNVGATIAAVEGIAGNKILIAGGLGKDADFTALGDVLKNNAVKLVLLFGQDAKKIAAVLTGKVDYQFTTDLRHAVELASQSAQAPASVLFSPACASFDMFKNFEHRGDMFCQYVKALAE